MTGRNNLLLKLCFLPFSFFLLPFYDGLIFYFCLLLFDFCLFTMGTLIVILITLVASASGTLLTYPFSERMPLIARLCAGSVVGLAALSWISFLISLAIGLNTASIL